MASVDFNTAVSRNQLFTLPPEILHQLLGQLEPTDLLATALTCKMIFEIICTQLEQEQRKVKILEDSLIEKMQKLSLKDAIEIPKITNKFYVRPHAKIIDSLYCELFTIKRIDYTGALDLALNPACLETLENLHTVLPLAQDDDETKKIKSSKRFGAMESLLRSNMNTLVRFITDKEITLLTNSAPKQQ
jgi:hypothetical protein